MEEDEENNENSTPIPTESTELSQPPPPPPPQPFPASPVEPDAEPEPEPETENGEEIQLDTKPELQLTPSDSASEDDPATTASDDTQIPAKATLIEDELDDDDEEEEDRPPKKQKQLSLLTTLLDPNLTLAADDDDNSAVEILNPTPNSTPITKSTAPIASGGTKKSKKKGNNVWVTKTSRKGKKKSKVNNQNSAVAEDTVLITPAPRLPDKGDDTPDLKICLSKVYKAEKVELSEDRMSAGSTKGYRMVRATRGVMEGAWYFEIKVVNLGETGHTRLGWCTEKGDLQAPVGYDGNSFGYRDIDGSKVHKALREKYGEEGYKEGDVIGFYINLPEGSVYAPKPPNLVWFKGQRYVCAPDAKEDPPKVVPGSEISFFRNGVCQGVAYKDLYGGRYYPAASMYTLPNQPNCEVKFNFGPDFECFPEEFGGRPLPQPLIKVPYHGTESRIENDVSDEKKQ